MLFFVTPSTDAFWNAWGKKNLSERQLSLFTLSCFALPSVTPQLFWKPETSSPRIVIQSKSICSLIVFLAFITAHEHEEHLSGDWYDLRSSCAIPPPIYLITSYENSWLKMVKILECGISKGFRSHGCWINNVTEMLEFFMFCHF